MPYLMLAFAYANQLFLFPKWHIAWTLDFNQLADIFNNEYLIQANIQLIITIIVCVTSFHKPEFGLDKTSSIN